jgi:hypothetical protein
LLTWRTCGPGPPPLHPRAAQPVQEPCSRSAAAPVHRVLGRELRHEVRVRRLQPPSPVASRGWPSSMQPPAPTCPERARRRRPRLRARPARSAVRPAPRAAPPGSRFGARTRPRSSRPSASRGAPGGNPHGRPLQGWVHLGPPDRLHHLCRPSPACWGAGRERGHAREGRGLRTKMCTGKALPRQEMLLRKPRATWEAEVAKLQSSRLRHRRCSRPALTAGFVVSGLLPSPGLLVRRSRSESGRRSRHRGGCLTGRQRLSPRADLARSRGGPVRAARRRPAREQRTRVTGAAGPMLSPVPIENLSIGRDGLTASVFSSAWHAGNLDFTPL